FSSRRRHTRFSRDWSSDVCSSDLLFPYDRLVGVALKLEEFSAPVAHRVLAVVMADVAQVGLSQRVRVIVDQRFRVPICVRHDYRSEERRVGKECRVRWSWNESRMQ